MYKKLEPKDIENEVFQKKYEYIGFVSLMIDNIENLKIVNEKYDLKKLETNFGKNLLMYAVHMNNYESVEYLLSVGFDPNGKTREISADYNNTSLASKTILDYALENASVEIIDLLLKNGAVDINNISDQILKYKNENKFFQPSFSKEKASTKIEKLIVNNKTLSILDREMGEAYKKVRKAFPKDKSYVENQRKWLKKRNELEKTIKDDEELKIRLIQMVRGRKEYLERILDKI